jgi:hypothetical protein
MCPIHAEDLNSILARPHAPREHYNPLARRHWNRNAGRCGKCGGHVRTGWGTLEEIEGRWRVVHFDGECEPLAPPTAPAGWQRKSYYRPDPADEE